MKVLGADAGSLAVGAGAILLAPVVMPLVGSILRPVAKGLIKGGLMAYGQAKAAVGGVQRMAAEGREVIQDLSAEARSELDTEPAKKPAASKSKSSQQKSS